MKQEEAMPVREHPLYNTEEMGCLDKDNKVISLFGVFSRRVMGFSLSDSEKTIEELNEKITQPMCPFCMIGHFEVKEVEARSDCGIHNHDKEDHTGNRYKLECTNPGCEGILKAYFCAKVIA